MQLWSILQRRLLKQLLQQLHVKKLETNFMYTNNELCVNIAVDYSIVVPGLCWFLANPRLLLFLLLLSQLEYINKDGHINTAVLRGMFNV